MHRGVIALLIAMQRCCIFSLARGSWLQCNAERRRAACASRNTVALRARQVGMAVGEGGGEPWVSREVGIDLGKRFTRARGYKPTSTPLDAHHSLAGTEPDARPQPAAFYPH